MPRIPLLFLLPPTIFAGLGLVFYFGLGREDPDALPSAFVGRMAPAVQVVPFEGAVTPTDADLAAEGVKLVNFWASWCAPCRVEHPHLETIAELGLPIHGINHKDDPAKARAFLEELGDPYATIGADAGRMAINWGVYGLPETFILDSEGRVSFRFAGPITRSVLENTIIPELRRAGAQLPQ